MFVYASDDRRDLRSFPTRRSSDLIKTAISQSQPGDLVVLAGKGEDAYQKIRGIDTPYPNDFNVAQQVVQELE